ncbi:MAG: 50S ribosomal protein L10 [Deltaproteobacteria bacterium RBG_19FT_COMBO_46_12]|nr:MAG: 50S ribosomal protein L10 [Deltaproteobacteria bacterium RBG_19FT_COMBO_46_12]
MNRKEKEQVISDLGEKVKGFQAAVLTNYRGLNVEQINHLRTRLREEKISYHVVKNTLMKLASKGTDLEKLNTFFEGPTAIAISYGDPVLLAKILSEFIKTQPSLKIKVGLIQGKVASPEEVKALATMPSREVLFSQILGGIQGAANQLGAVIYNALQQVVGTLQSRVDQLSQQNSEEPKPVP